jgi:ribonuclease E
MPAAAQIAPVEIAPVEAAPVDDTPIEATPVIATPTDAPVEDAAVEAEAAASGSEIVAQASEPVEAIAKTPAPVAAEEKAMAHDTPPPAADVETDAPVVAAAERTMTEIRDVARVQAIASEIQSISEAAARDIAAAAARTGEPDTHFESHVPGVDDVGSDSTPPEPVTADPTEPRRRTLAQKVRGWFGHAA